MLALQANDPPNMQFAVIACFCLLCMPNPHMHAMHAYVMHLHANAYITMQACKSLQIIANHCFSMKRCLLLATQANAHNQANACKALQCKALHANAS